MQLQHSLGFRGFSSAVDVLGAVHCEGVALLGAVDVSWRAAGTSEL